MLRTGALIDDRYRVLREIGRGGMGIVYLVLNERTNCLQAVKVIKAEGDTASLLEEMQVLRSLRHRMLPEIVDAALWEGTVCLIMQYVEGEDLMQIVRSRRVSLRDALAWSMQLCGLLKYLHERPVPVYHLDLKPSNLIVDREGSLFLIDFGSARIDRGSQPEVRPATGTPGFAAPELFLGGEGDAQSDIYSVGALLFYLLLGRKPAGHPTCRACRKALAASGYGQGYRARMVAGCLADCLSADPARRPESCGELQMRLCRAAGMETAAQVLGRAEHFTVILFFIMSLLCLMASPLCFYASLGMRGRIYRADLEQASLTAGEEQQRLLTEAACLYPDREEPYAALLEAMTLDGAYSAEEAASMTKLLYGRSMGRIRENVSYLQEDIPAFCHFTYQMGLACYYLGDGFGDRQTAAGWLRQAAEYGLGVEENLLPADREALAGIRENARILLELCNYYKSSLRLSGEQAEDDAGLLWNRMEGLLDVRIDQKELEETWILKEWLGMFYDNMESLREQVGEEAVSQTLKELDGRIRLQEEEELTAWYAYVVQDWQVLCRGQTREGEDTVNDSER